MEQLGKRPGNTYLLVIINRIKEMEEGLSGLEDNIEDIDTSVKENAKCTKFLTENIQESWDTMKRPNLWVIGTEKGKDCWFKRLENILNKIIRKLC